MITEIKVPSPGESITEVQISRWIKNDGDYVEKDEEIAEIDSDKATLTVAAEQSGKLSIKVKEGETVTVGSVICTIDTEAASSEKPKAEEKAAPKAEKDAANVDEKKSAEVKGTSEEKDPAEDKKSTEEKKSTSYASGVPSPAAEKILKEKGITPEAVKGSGKDGRITKGDVISSSNATAAAAPATSASASAAAPVPGTRNIRRDKLSMLRKKLAQRLVAVKNETAMLTTFNEVDMSAIMEIRKLHKDKFKEKHGVGLGFMSFFTKAVCEALKEFPAVNAMIDGDEIVYHDYCDIGIAVSAPKGLMVPVMRNAETLTLAQIESQVMALAGKAREGKITIDEMTGGTFTITNGGVFGSMLSTPIINPQSAILGMHNIVERPVAINGKVEIRPIMYVALSYDHRIIDGRESVSFLVKVKQMLEEPVKMLYGGNDPTKVLLGL
ncbi:MAG TPA: 2-oxoglutarate dehydrogenase complex dihydrolipoyllysine-residue succinyltransferase [Bacteroidia bacterium]|nr:2-oxoglutarate dehydrogenase complex dihydrolipoyllysine-residue succinyltransferase [Bacteroidia bacterium]